MLFALSRRNELLEVRVFVYGAGGTLVDILEQMDHELIPLCVLLDLVN